MLRRTAFRRKPPLHEPSREREPRPMAKPERWLASSPVADSVVAVPKEPAPVRDEAYRRWVATLPCYECRIHGYSQCAHPNSGKAKGKKLSDAECFPMCCDRPGVVGCHVKFDRYELVPRAEMPAYEQRAAAWTKEQRRIA